MKRILVITPFFYPHIGGSEKYMEELYAYIKKENAQISIDVLCYNTNHVNEKENYRGLNVFRIPCFVLLPDQFCLPKPMPLLKFLYRNKDYDLIHCSTRFFDSSWWAPIFAKLTGKKIVLTDHCAYHPVHKNPILSWLAKLVDLSVSRFFLNFYDEVYTESKSTKKFLKQVFNIESKVAYPGLEGNKYSVKPKKGRLKIVFIGRLIESKGVKNLFDIAIKSPKAKFIFAGPGPLFEELKNRIKKGKIKNISVLGQISYYRVRKLLESSDIFVYPSFHSEGLPLSLMEAGASGIAVLATDVGGIGEIIIHNKTGILVKPKDEEDFKDSLQRLIEDKSLRLKLGKNLQEFVYKNFSWQKAAALVIKELN